MTKKLDTTQHAGRYRLLIQLPSGYGMDISWENADSMEGALRSLVEYMDESDGIEMAIKTVIDTLVEVDACVEASKV